MTIPSKLSYKSIPLQTEELDSSFSGYASIFNIADECNDVILPQAFGRLNPSSVKLLWQHDTKSPIGRIKQIYEDDYGLYIQAELLLELVKGKEAYHLMQQGIINGLSIGFIPIDYFYDGNFRYIEKVKLLEISLVTFPANEKAKIDKEHSNTLVHSILLNLDKAKQVIRSGGR